MTRMVAISVLALLAVLPSCATNSASTPSATGTPPTDNPALTLTNRSGDIRLNFPDGGLGTLQLRAFGEVLIGVPDRQPSSVTQSFATGSSSFPELWIDGRAVSIGTSAPLRIDAPISGVDWQYSRVEVPVAKVAGLRSFQRRFLCIEPDLMIILDEVSLEEPAVVDTGYWFPSTLVRDAVRDEWTVQTLRAGVTARFLSSPKSMQSRWGGSDNLPPDAATNSTRVCVRSTIAEKVREFHQVTVLVVHREGTKHSLAFKLLESDTAIGVRVHRDGLPTLAAFRKTSCTGEANLTGMKFDGPVGVDVFRPKKR